MVQFLIFVSVFVSSIVFFKAPFEGYLHYLVFLTFIPVFAARFGYPKYLAQILIVLAGIGLVNVGLGVYPPFDFIKVWGGLFLSVTFYHYVLRYYKFNIVQIFKVYGAWSYYVCLIGIAQLVSYRLGIGFGYNYSWLFNKWGLVEGGLLGIRVNSIFSEPSTLAGTIAPAAYFAVYNLLHKDNFLINKKQSIVILIVYILASSSTAYLALLVILFLVTDGIKLRYFVVGTLVAVGLFGVMYSKSEDFRTRVDTSEQLWLYQNYSLENTNSSSFVLYNGFVVATSNISEFPFFGSGLGSYKQAYEKHSLTKTVLNYDFEFNTTDGNSTLIRLTVETGIVGTVLFLFLLFRCFIPKKNSEDALHFRLISQAIFVMMLVYLLRQGNYFLNAFPFFVMMYYFNWKQYKMAMNNPVSITTESNEIDLTKE